MADVAAMVDVFSAQEALVLHDDMVLHNLFCNEDDGPACNIGDALFLVFCKYDVDAVDDGAVPGHWNL
jgi:hypothetical protein